MKAIVYNDYGSPDVLQLRDIVRPTPKENEIVVRVRATTVNYGDLIARNFKNVSPREFNMSALFWLPAKMEFGFSKPKNPILGSEFAGEVVALGKDVTKFKVGDAVFGYLGQRMGAYAEFCCVAENGTVALKPANMSFAEAATVPYGAIMALGILKKANLQRGQKVLIIGASGGIGSAAVQLANYYGAEVTGVCGTLRLEFVKSLGAGQAIDYTKEDFTKGAEMYDLIFDVLGKSNFSRCKRVLKDNGRYLLASFKTKQLLQMLWTSKIGTQKVICAFAAERSEDLEFIKDLIEAGAYKAIIDKQFSMEQAVEAHRYVEAGLKRGHVVIDMQIN